MDDEAEAYMLLLLSDGNLPTGSFVASAGLESYIAHGFFTTSPSRTAPAGSAALNSTSDFVRDSLSSYAHTALPFVADAHRAVGAFLDASEAADAGGADLETGIATVLARLDALDRLYECTTLNHVARRASKAQGVALLSLYTKGFARPAGLALALPPDDGAAQAQVRREARASALVDRLKLRVRREEAHGHLPICWAALTAALGLSTARSQRLHLFLQARSLLSAAVRLNAIGPYAAQQLLLHAVRPLVDAEMARCKHLRTGLPTPDAQMESAAAPFDDTTDGPACTWPLGEILAARHDLQHSRIFNS